MPIPSISSTTSQLNDTSTALAAEAIRNSPVTANTRREKVTEAQSAPASREDVQSSVKALNDFVASINSSSLNFSVDEDTGKTVVKVTDSATHEVIKQIPSEEILAVAQAIDKLKGLLVQQKV